MKYLDAKKRLAFMSATVKYIRMWLNDNPAIVTNDMIDAKIAEAIHIKLADYRITTKDKADITNGIKSCLVATSLQTLHTDVYLELFLKNFETLNINEKIKIYDKLCLESVAFETLGFDNFMQVCSKVAPKFAQITGIKTSSSLSSTGTLDTSLGIASQVKTDSTIKTEPELTAKLVFSNIFELLETAATAYNVAVNTVKTSNITTDEIIKLESAFLLDLVEIKAGELNISSNVTLNPKFLLNVDKLATILIDTRSKSKDRFEFASVNAPKIVAADTNKINIITAMLLMDSKASVIQTNAKIVAKPTFELNANRSPIISTDSLITDIPKFKIQLQVPTGLEIDENLKTESTVTLELSDLTPVEYGINESDTLSHFVSPIVCLAKEFESSAKLYVVSDITINDSLSRYISYSTHNNLEDFIAVEEFRYAFLGEWDPECMEDILDLSINRLILKQFND